MYKTILHIGSNRGDKEGNLSFARKEIEKLVGRITRLSSIFETEPWGIKDQEFFLNQGMEVTTELTAFDIFEKCKKIEDDFGRHRKIKWGPRLIDIDIIFFENDIISSDKLTIPHPRMQDRNFVLHPLNEIIPGWKHPLLEKSVSQLMDKSSDSLKILQLV